MQEKIFIFLKKGIFPYRGNAFKTKEESEENKFFKYIENESKCINYDLFRKYFDFETPTQLIKNYLKQKVKNNNDFVGEINNRWSKLEDEIEEMSENEKKVEQPDKILTIGEEILNFNK